MTEGQYRAIVAYLTFWTPQYPDLGLDAAMRDIGITAHRGEVIHDLWKAGHIWDDDKGVLIVDGDLITQTES